MVSLYLFVLFKASLNQGCLPFDWLRVNIAPMHKDRRKLLAASYRTASLISTSCKLLEHGIASKITPFPEPHNILVDFKHESEKRLYTTTQLFWIVHDFANIVNIREPFDVAFLDLSKVFDSVSHHLFKKLQHVGIAPGLVSWIAANLTNRTQFVEINGCECSYLDVLSAVPQGSVLGPPLFLVCVNDIAAYLDTGVSVKIFAHDCVIYRSFNKN